MNMKSVFARSFVISMICLILFAGIATLIGSHAIAWFDDRIIATVQGWESDSMTDFMKFFTLIGSGVPVVVITAIAMGILYFALKHRLELVFFAGVVIGSALLNQVLKLLFHRERPTLHRIVEQSGFSFPSGHSMAAFTLYGVLCFLLWKHIGHPAGRIAMIMAGCLLTALIGTSRIYLGVHYPSDVVGGFLCSGTWLAASIGYYRVSLEQRIARRRAR